MRSRKVQRKERNQAGRMGQNKVENADMSRGRLSLMGHNLHPDITDFALIRLRSGITGPTAPSFKMTAFFSALSCIRLVTASTLRFI